MPQKDGSPTPSVRNQEQQDQTKRLTDAGWGSTDHGWVWAGECLRIQGFKDVVSLERVGESLERPKCKSHFIIVGRGAWDMRGTAHCPQRGVTVNRA